VRVHIPAPQQQQPIQRKQRQRRPGCCRQHQVAGGCQLRSGRRFAGPLVCRPLQSISNSLTAEQHAHAQGQTHMHMQVHAWAPLPAAPAAHGLATAGAASYRVPPLLLRRHCQTRPQPASAVLRREKGVR
jgi:hypothetical protein